MSNTKTWPSPDQQAAGQGRQDVRAVYLIDPTTNLAYAASGGGGGGAIADTIATGNLTAAQPTVGTPVTGGTVSITLGNEQGTVEAQLTGTFSSGTTIQFEGTDDAGTTTNWFATFGKDTTVANAPNISSVAGPGPYLVRIPAAGYQQIRVRASALTGGDNVAVRLIGSVAGTGGANLATNDGSFAKETGGNLASAKADLDTIVTQTAGLATAANQSTGNTSLSSIATNTSNAATNTSNTSTVLGATGDAATTGDTSGSVSAKLRGLTKILADIWDSTNHWFKVSVQNTTIAVTGTFWQTTQPVSSTDLGTQSDSSATSDTGTFSLIALFKRLLAKFPAIGAQATSNSLAVNIASDQVVPMKLSAVAVYTQASTTTSGSTQNSGDLAVGAYREISIDINTTAQAGTSPTIQYFYERKGADGIYYVLWQSNSLTAAANTLSTSIGSGMAYNQSLGNTGRLRWVVGGSATPTFTHTLNIYGK